MTKKKLQQNKNQAQNPTKPKVAKRQKTDLDRLYREYKEKYGRCETESQPFECKICGKVIKYDRNTVHTHLKNVHGINWEKYLNRIRKLRRGLEPDPLPAMKMVECRVCNISVKYLKEHLRNAHKITEKEYRELFRFSIIIETHSRLTIFLVMIKMQ